MDVDLSEYDQMEEITSGKDVYFQSSSKVLVTISSGSNQDSSSIDTNCENDFVFLPSFPNTLNQQNLTQTKQNERSSLGTAQYNDNDKSRKNNENKNSGISSKKVEDRVNKGPLEVTTRGNSMLRWQEHQLTTTSSQARRETDNLGYSKPIGVIRHPAILIDQLINYPGRSTNKLAELMQQIVTKSDLINISIPCQFCAELTDCPPSDISSWLNHMNLMHNCKVCPVCNQLVGLGPRREAEVMRAHVNEHFDDEWLEAKPTKTNFSFGLQQQWFSGYKCAVRENHSRWV